MQKSHRAFYFTLLVFFTFAVASAHADTPTITLVTTYDHPYATFATAPGQINNRGDIAGFFSQQNGVAGYVRVPIGTFGKPIVAPNAVFETFATGINSARTVCGSYADASGNLVGFFLTGATFTDYSFAGATSTQLLSVNDQGNFAGTEVTAGSQSAFASIAGTASVINVPGAAFSVAYAINNFDDVAGYYADRANNFHGFLRNADGTFVGPIDYPQAPFTQATSVSDRRVIVGLYDDSDGNEHGFLLKLPHTFVSYDYPGATFTDFYGINARGEISGAYGDSHFVEHAFIAQVSD